MPAPLIIAGGAALAAWLISQEGCGGDPGKPEPLSEGNFDSSAEGGDGISVDAKTGEVDVGEVKADTVDGSIKKDGLAENAEVKGDTVSESSYICKVLAENKYGMKHAMLLQGELSSGKFEFKAAAGTDTAVENERLNNKAEDWPKAGQEIPEFAEDLVARYDISKDGNELTISNYTSKGLVSNAALFPMTLFDDLTGQPEIVKTSTDNEIYVAFKQSLEITVGCNGGGECDNGFEGSAEISDTVWSGIGWLELQNIEINCYKE